MTLIGEVPIGFVTDLVTQRLRDAALQRRLTTMVEGEALDVLMRDLEPRRVPTEALPELRPLEPALGLRAARRAAKLSTRELAERVGISITWLRNLETGVGEPSPVVARRLAEALKRADLFPSPRQT